MRILISVDLRDEYQECIRIAVPWAERLGATADLVYVSRSSTTERDLKRLEGLMGFLPRASQGEAVLITGTPGEALCKKAAGYDAVLIATHGRTGVNRLVLGSVAEKVVRGAPCPVIVLRLDKL